MYLIKIDDTVLKEKIIEGELVTIDPTLILQEQEAALESKRQEVQAKVDAYKAAQQHQLQNGGAGPVAEVEIMKIVNEYNGIFEIVFKNEE